MPDLISAWTTRAIWAIAVVIAIRLLPASLRPFLTYELNMALQYRALAGMKSKTNQSLQSAEEKQVGGGSSWLLQSRCGRAGAAIEWP